MVAELETEQDTVFGWIGEAYQLDVAAGAGATSRQEIGTAAVGGMIAASTLALLFVPLFYKLFEDLATWRIDRKQRKEQGDAA